MQVSTLVSAVKTAAKISNPGSLTPLHRCIELGPECIRACSEFGNIEIFEPVVGVVAPTMLETTALLAVLASLPGTEELTFTVKGTQLHWSSKDARGHWQTVQQEHKIPQLAHQEFPWKPVKDFGKGLVIAASAVQASAVSFGLFGVELRIDRSVEPHMLRMISSNSNALAYAEVVAGTLSDGLKLTKVTLRPPVPSILAHVMTACKDPMLDITQEGIHLYSEQLVAYFACSTPLEHDLMEVRAKYPNAIHLAEVKSDLLKKFLSRAKSLADKKNAVQIGMKIEGGRLLLEHRGLTASSEEYFLADGLDESVNYASVNMPLDMLLTPLENIDAIVLDYLPQNILILVGVDFGFQYILGGNGGK